MSALMEVDRRGRVVNYKLRETVIRSDERMTYTDVNKLLTHADRIWRCVTQNCTSFLKRWRSWRAS